MNDSNSEVITLEVDETPAVESTARANAAIDSYGKTATRAFGVANKAAEEHGGLVVRTSDRTRSSVERLTASFEKQAATMGKTPMERLISQHDQLVRRLGNDQAAIERVNTAFEKQRTIIASSAPEMDRFAAGADKSRLSLALLGQEAGVHVPRQLRGFISELPGVGRALSMAFSAFAIIGVIEIIGVAVKKVIEFREELEKMHEAPERMAAVFGRFTNEQKLANEEMMVTNDHLRNAIAKLEHRPENNLKLAIDEAAVAAGHLADRMDKALKGFFSLVKENAPGTLARFWGGGQANTKDIQELVGGKTGFGGMVGDIYKATNAGQDPTAVLSGYQTRAQRMLDVSQNAQNFQQGRSYRTDLGPIETTANQDARIEILRGLLQEISLETNAYKLEKEGTTLTATKDRLESGKSQTNADFEWFQVKFRETLEKQTKIIDDQNKALEKMIEGSAKLREIANPEMAANWDSAGFGSPFVTRNLQAQAAGIWSYGRQGNQKTQDQQGAELAEWQKYKDADELKSDQRHLSALEKQEQLELQIVKIHTTGGERSAIERTLQLRLEYAQKIHDVEAKTIGDVAAGEKLRDRQEDANIQAVTSAMEIQQKEFENIKRTAAGLWETLFTHPQNFGKQLSSTVREAAMKPATEALGGLTAGLLAPLLGGGGKLGDVHLVNGAVPVHIVNAMGGGGTTIYSSGGYSGGGSTFISGGGYSPVGSSGTGYIFNLPGPQAWGSPLGMASMVGLGGTPGFMGDSYNPMSSGSAGGSRGGFNPLGMLLGGGKGGPGGSGINGLLGSLKSNWWNSDLTTAGGGLAWQGGVKGDLAGVLSSKGAKSLGTAGGMMLAQHGLMGIDEGTASGMFQGTLGGATAGFMMGGPIGAAIGGAAGFLAGAGEMIAGVESPQHQAARLIKSIYGVGAPETGSLVKQIAAMAQQYGGNVSMAVRTPQARQLIELYSMGTGQGSRGMFLDTPQQGHIVQQGNQTYQGLSYFNGSGYNYQSSLPTLGNSAGLIPTANPYSGGGPTSIQLDGPATTALLSGQVAKTANPDYVGQQSVAALNSGGSRYATAAAVLSPGTIFA